MSTPQTNPVLELVVVKNWLQIRKSKAKFSTLIKPYFKSWALIAGLLAFIGPALYIGFPPTFGALYIGILIGAISRDIGMTNKTRKLWPIIEKYLDWQKIEETDAKLK